MEIGSKRKYKSPNYKLVDCFHKSRDGWKKKAQEAKRTVRKLKERLKKVRARRDYWKELAQQRSPVEPRETLKKPHRDGDASGRRAIVRRAAPSCHTRCCR